MEKKIGFTIGKFAPLHKGHQYLIETALKEMDEFYVIIYETNLINIPTEVRANWIKTLYPTVKVLVAVNPPNQYGLDNEIVKIQMKYLIKIIDNIKVTHFYSSELYGEKVSEYLNIVDRRIDHARMIVPISASKIRENLDKYKNYLEPMVYKDMKKY